MGAAQSTPSQIEGGQLPTTSSPPRNKLTKPRTNSNNTREASCLPSLPLSLSLSRSSLHGNSKPSSAVHYQSIIEDQTSGAIFAIEYSQTAQSIAGNQTPGRWDRLGDHVSDHPTRADNPSLNSMSAANSAPPLVLSPTLVSNGIPRRGSMATRSSANGYTQPPNRNPDIPSMGTVRRRSLLIAAPPATATRKPTRSRRNSIEVSSIPSDPFTLSPEQEYDLGRCTTPSGYSVLGAFKRGSLRIANGAASPAPSSCAGSPEASARIDYIGSTFAAPEAGGSNNRPPSRVKPIIIVPYPAHEVRLVPPSPTGWDEEKMPGSPFSFMRSPSIYNDEDTLDLPVKRTEVADFAPEGSKLPTDGPMDSHENLVSGTSNTICAKSKQHGVLAKQSSNQYPSEPTCDSPKTTSQTPITQVDEYHSTLYGEALKDNDRRLRRPSITKASGEGTDSGYSSSGSVNSWKSVLGDQSTEPNPIARKLGNPRPATKANSMPFLGVVGMVGEIDMKSRTRNMVAAIRRRYSQGDLKASARSMEFTKPPPVPAAPALEHKKTLTKFRPELKHRRSMVAITKNPTKTPEIQKPSPAIAPVPPLPRPRLERRGSFNLLALEDYLPLVEDLPFTPIIDRAPNTINIPYTGVETNIRESVIRIGVGRTLSGGSKITGQDYYQRFSRTQHARIETLVG